MPVPVPPRWGKPLRTFEKSTMSLADLAKGGNVALALYRDADMDRGLFVSGGRRAFEGPFDKAAARYNAAMRSWWAKSNDGADVPASKLYKPDMQKGFPAGWLTADDAKLMGDRRFNYKAFSDLSQDDQNTARRSYPNKSPGAKYDFKPEHYYYAVDKTGKLSRTARYRTLAIPKKIIDDDKAMSQLGYTVREDWGKPAEDQANTDNEDYEAAARPAMRKAGDKFPIKDINGIKALYGLGPTASLNALATEVYRRAERENINLDGLEIKLSPDKTKVVFSVSSHGINQTDSISFPLNEGSWDLAVAGMGEDLDSALEEAGHKSSGNDESDDNYEAAARPTTRKITRR